MKHEELAEILKKHAEFLRKTDGIHTVSDIIMQAKGMEGGEP